MISTDQEGRLFEFQAAICRTFANPWRLRIVEILGDGELTVSQLVEALGIPKSNVSQHLGVMRERGVVQYRREGGARILLALQSQDPLGLPAHA